MPTAPLPRRGSEPSAVDPASGIEEVGAAVVDCAIYDGGERQGGRVELEEALARADECSDGFVWIGLHDPGPGVVEKVAEHFGLHPLAVEDAVHAHQRAKLEVYDESLFLVMKTARYVDSEELVQIGELMVFLGQRFVVTVRHGEGSALADVRRDLESHPDLLAIGPSAVLYAVADRVVDDYAEAIDGFEEDIEQVETEVFSAEGRDPAERIYRLKRELLQFRRAVQPLIAPMQRLSSKQTGLPVDPRTGDYFRDVQDHLVRDADRITGFDELLTGVLQANLTRITLRDNQDMRRISSWVAIVAVPTMIFGMYGMNFEHMPELKWELGYPAVLVVTLGICLGLYRRFRAAGWL